MTFNKAVEAEAVAKEDVTVVNKETGDKQYVKTVTLSEDKKSVAVELYESLTKGSYTATVKDGDKVSSKDFDFVAGEVAKIEVKTSQVIPANKDSKISYKLLDAAGVDVTAENEDKVKFEATAPITEDGIITLDKDGAIAFAYVIVTKTDGTVVKSDKITVKAEDPKPVDLINWSVSTAEEVEFDSADYKQNTTVTAESAVPYQFHVELKDQFGEKYNEKPQYESLDKTVALVDRENGTVTPIKDGSAPVKISVVKDGKTLYSKIVEIKTVAKALASKLELKENQVTVSSSLLTHKEVVLTFKDQYGTDISYDGDVFVKIKSGDKEIIETLSETLTGNGKERTLKVTPVEGKEGTVVIELSLNDQVKTELTVKVEKAGQVADFKVTGFEKELDKNAANKDAKSTMELKVYGVDDKGGQAAQVKDGLFYSVKDSTGKEVEKSEPVAGSLKIDANGKNKDDNYIYEAGKEYTVTVKMGSNEATAYQVFSDKFTIKDTKELPKVSLTKGTVDINLSKGDKITNSVTLKELFAVTFTGATESDITINDFAFKGDNENVIGGTTATTAIVKKAGTASLVIKSVDVTVKGTSFTVKLDGEVLKVNVKGQTEKAEEEKEENN
ncbi:hypothetical protein JNUCC42_16780 [Brevibacterium sp. JNUCC-42]|nr:hypothetical protein JNUCC42_16780 [Brevibacterium sp. JNUCC-42]